MKCVGWVEERNPTFRDFVGLSFSVTQRCACGRSRTASSDIVTVDDVIDILQQETTRG
ncbi:hypothetical protein [Nostoc sphaeroides]|uniref:Uncharacterized protein n=1 Tax=Nostoc sphaeroides CCNUC1 TaxID=2653204 RepID=A0A5P8W4W5_9NOSO|nr:hypothetical protein [Nostoc sphaeroides]QFS47049.1 hypothetical protein GXM_04530 [Nostoc sphaeroides CCNUC1]